jgi:hypothetical protein
MKKIFRIASFALLLAVGVACSTDDVPQEPLGTYPILFRCMDETRAVATVESMMSDAQGFDVYAFFTNNNASQSFDKNVKYTNGSWTYQHNNQALEYWIPGATYYFKAVYPTNIKYEVDNSSTAQPLTITDYDITKQYDILVAETSRDGLFVNADGEPESGSVVLLKFEHLLANVTIKAKSQIDGVIMQKIVIGSADTNSTYNGSVWSLSGNTTSIEYSQPTTLKKGAEFVDVTNGGILVIPASANNKTLTIQANKTYKLKFPTGTWEPGNKYTYTLEIKQDDIIFVDDAPYVEEWDSENATGSVIIK